MRGKIIYETKPSHSVNFWVYFVCFVFFFLIFPVFIAIAELIKLNNIKYSMSELDIQIQQGVFTRKVEHLELFRVKDASLTQSLIQRIVKSGNILIYSSDKSKPVLELKGIKEPYKFLDLLFEKVDEQRKKYGVKESDFYFSSET